MDNGYLISDLTGVPAVGGAEFVTLPDGRIFRWNVLQTVIALERKLGCVLPCQCPDCLQKGVRKTFDYFVWTTEKKIEGSCARCGGNFPYAL